MGVFFTICAIEAKLKLDFARPYMSLSTKAREVGALEILFTQCDVTNIRDYNSMALKFEFIITSATERTISLL